MQPSRRAFLIAAPAALTAAGLAPAHAAQQSATDPHASFPLQDPALVREIVGASHRDIDRVRALLQQAPQLANASIDWGFGDWESALGAAAHTGRVNIAELLLAHGARADLFALTMLGKLDAVKAIIESSPGIQRTRGPHAISLLAHARAGGDHAKPVLDYLTTLGDADLPLKDDPLTPDQRAIYLGTYAYGPDPSQRFAIEENREALVCKRATLSPQRLRNQGDHTFMPAGGLDVRLVFEVENNRAVRITVTTPAALLTAEHTAAPAP